MKRLYLLFLCALLLSQSYGQITKKRKSITFNKQNKENDLFLQKQWWLGLKAGPNFSKPVIEKTYSILAPTNYESSLISKEYDNFRQLGSHVTFEASFYFRGFYFSFQPTYQHARFTYENNFQWLQDGQPALTLNYEQDNKLDHASLPVIIKYEIAGRVLRTYLQVGYYSALLLNANKEVTVSGVDYASGGVNEFRDETIMIGASDLFAKNHWGLLGGAGLNYNRGNVRFNLDVVYKHGMSNISSTKNRYSNDRLSGIGDAMDDVKLDNVSLSLGCLFPMRFLSNGFKSLDRK